jgi:glycosyltransferase involved in cell wall biosynthesis
VAEIKVQLLDLEDRTCLRLPEGFSRGTALIGFPRIAARANEGDALLFGHSLFWEARETMRTFLGLGYDVDVIDLGLPPPQGGGPYQVSLTLHHQLHLVEPVLAPGAIKINWLTASNPIVRNARELQRIRALEQRRNCHYTPKRQVVHVDAELAAIEKADHCVLIGNQVTLDTYPKRWHHKIEPFCVSGANIAHVKRPSAYVPSPREFVWFSASGAVMKGLDLLLDVFDRYELPTLHVCGMVSQEEDFAEIYRSQLNGHPRIQVHGFLQGNDPKLASIFDRCVAVLHPSADEGMAGSVAHCLEVGLYPVISRVTGIDLPAGCGRTLESYTEEEVVVAIADVLHAPEATLVQEIASIQHMAHERFSQASYSRRLREMFEKWLGPPPAAFST